MTALNRLCVSNDPAEFQALLDTIPYARFLGMRVERDGGDIVTVLPFQDMLVGNPLLPALHGGVTGAFLEVTATMEILREICCERLPKPVDISIDYLRSGRPETTRARAVVSKHGRRVVNVRAEAWQDDPGRPIAAMHGHFLLQWPEEPQPAGAPS
ncbi:MAG: PaaI family thioesterase [Alphaproteobacteria bacterium]